MVGTTSFERLNANYLIAELKCVETIQSLAENPDAN